MGAKARRRADEACEARRILEAVGKAADALEQALQPIETTNRLGSPVVARLSCNRVSRALRDIFRPPMLCAFHSAEADHLGS